MIYMDNAATTKPCGECTKAVLKTMEECFGNAGSLHHMGTVSGQIISRTKASLLSAVTGIKTPFNGTVLFTSGATESNNTALFGVFEGYPKGGRKIVTTSVEHPSTARVIDKLEAQGCDVARISPKDFQNSEEFANAIINAVDNNTSLVSAMAVNNETGYKINVPYLYKHIKLKNPKTVVHIDAVQGFLKVPLDGDLISVSGHKVHGPKGIGALFIKRGIRIPPLIYGGGQQGGLRSGTEPIELIAGFEASVKAYRGNTEYFSKLKDHLATRLSLLPDIRMNSDENCIPNIVNFSVCGVRSEIMLHSLEENEIYVSSGSACSKGKRSNVLPMFGVSEKDTDCAVRVSFCAENTCEEIDKLCDKIAKTIERVKR